MPCCEIDLAPLPSISRTMEQSLLFLLGGLLHSIPAIGYIDVPIFVLLLLGRPLIS
jgi:hypothetical protein